MARRIRSAIGAGLILLPTVSVGQDLTRVDHSWSRYRNGRFGTLADVPRIFTIAEPQPANGDGQTFRSADGAELRVFGSHGATTVAENFAAYRNWLLDRLREDGVTITYKAKGKEWFAASGTRDRDIVYVKAIEDCGAIHEIRVTYPVALRQAYDPLMGHMARSLGCLP
ncbi:hypothetical protein [Microvirga mediterraneensis]|uniref:Uncharacterized protein n=1 Tax=Microvirga mediterraneensis TaxID=2754695 RepID=A0A838BNM1_9HYPH|nr:hypothetical protein [Microvirga mediterraneensis]MBA1156655.1 hypothetical protein [Microvirga mediterraneensis]